MEQRARRPLPGQLAEEAPPAIPSPRREVDLPLVDDEVDTDTTPATTANAVEVQEGLTEREREILAFERQAWRHAGAKEQAIRDRFELSATRYYQLLNALLDNPAALEHDPVLVGRLRRLRGSRARARGR
ncbi:MAG TPA: DUF3263 domain-containing protein [Candidatus Limnocylindrales bacterium]